jgi:hypothetical protein
VRDNDALPTESLAVSRTGGNVLNPGDPDLISAVDRHIARTVAPVTTVFHEIISPDLHIDVHHIAPSTGRPFHALVTSGMSERPMNTGPDATEFRFAEVAILLEPRWPMEHARFDDENVYWPVRLLKTVARFPSEADTWVGMGHSIAAANPPEPFAPETELAACILLPPLSLGEAFMTMDRPDGARTYFWNVVPLYADELDLKLAMGTDALMDALDRVGVDDVVRQSRPRATVRRNWFGLF